MTISKLANMRTFAILVLIMGTKYAIANEGKLALLLYMIKHIIILI